MNCPKCNRKQHFTCSDKTCTCNLSIPKDEKPQIYLGNDLLSCPYCGFTEHIDFWEDLELTEVENESN